MMFRLFIKLFSIPDPCRNVQCGFGSCRTENHVPVCYCQEGYQVVQGQCQDVNECQDNPCHPSATCTNLPGSYRCQCPEGNVGDAYGLTGCKPKSECLTSADCSAAAACESGRCIDPCLGFCGPGARCDVKNHLPVCTCPFKWTGDPRVKCVEMECVENTNCPADRSCVNNKCEDVCSLEGACGPNSQCTTINHIPLCSCNNGFSGDPRIGCTRIIQCANDIECPTNMMCAFGVCAGTYVHS